jgi:two-component system, OmpR family, sensor kinase
VLASKWVVEISGRLPVQRKVGGRLAVESSLVVGGVLAIGFVAAGLLGLVAVDEVDGHFVLAVLAAGAGAAAVGLGHTAGRIAGNRRASWLVPALALYSLVVIPSTAVPAAATGSRPVVLVGFLWVAVLLLVAIRPPGRLGSRAGWAVAAAGAVLVLILAALDGVVPAAVPVLSSRSAINTVVLLGWCAVSLAVVVAGYCMASPPLWRIGLGFGVIASAHLSRTVWPPPPAQPSLVFGCLRLYGVIVVLLGMAQLLRRCLSQVLTDSFVQQEELRLACFRVQELARSAAEREHELRNGLAGLTGITQLLDARADDAHARRARDAAAAELRRMSELLDRGRRRLTPPVVYCASELVEGLVALWRAAGMDITCTVASGLLVLGRPATLAQTLSNVLANCARHAPGATVRLVGCPVDGRVVVEVRNDRPGSDRAVDGGSDTAGQGIGLRISSRLLRSEDAELRVHPGDAARPGFTVTIVLRAGSEGRPGGGPRPGMGAPAEHRIPA